MRFPRCRRLPWRFLLLVGLLLLASCSPGGPQVVRVAGTATRNGQPVPDLLVTFIPEHGRKSWGITDADGHFVLHYDKDRDGAVVGRHTVLVTYKPRNPGEDPTKRPDLKEILAKYDQQETSPLKIRIVGEDDQLELPLD